MQIRAEACASTSGKAPPEIRYRKGILPTLTELGRLGIERGAFEDARSTLEEAIALDHPGTMLAEALRARLPGTDPAPALERFAEAESSLQRTP